MEELSMEEPSVTIKRVNGKSEIVADMYERCDAALLDIDTDINNVFRKDLFVNTNRGHELTNLPSQKIELIIRRLQDVRQTAKIMEALDGTTI